MGFFGKKKEETRKVPEKEQHRKLSPKEVADTTMIAPDDYKHIYDHRQEKASPTKEQTREKVNPKEVAETKLIAPADYQHIYDHRKGKEKEKETPPPQKHRRHRKLPSPKPTSQKQSTSSPPKKIDPKEVENTKMFAPEDYEHIYDHRKEAAKVKSEPPPRISPQRRERETSTIPEGFSAAASPRDWEYSRSSSRSTSSSEDKRYRKVDIGGGWRRDSILEDNLGKRGSQAYAFRDDRTRRVEVGGRRPPIDDYDRRGGRWEEVYDRRRDDYGYQAPRPPPPSAVQGIESSLIRMLHNRVRLFQRRIPANAVIAENTIAEYEREDRRSPRR